MPIVCIPSRNKLLRKRALNMGQAEQAGSASGTACLSWGQKAGNMAVTTAWKSTLTVQCRRPPAIDKRCVPTPPTVRLPVPKEKQRLFQTRQAGSKELRTG